MNISTDTIAVLKNFSDINQNILIKPGNVVQTISTMKNILAEAEITEKFDSEFAIYDLPEFLRSVELFDKPQLKFNGESNVKIESGAQSIKYFFADKSVIVAPKKSINMPDSLVIGETDKEFSAFFKTENFKQIVDDYDVAISKQKISHFVNRNKSIQYWIALEPDSEF